MYGITHAVIAALGCSPGLGFVHPGHELSFVMDIADLYKTEIGIPLAFDVAIEGEEDVGPRTRRALRDRINQTRLLDRCVRDITHLLTPTHAQHSEADIVTLQTDGGVHLASGKNYADEGIW